MKKKTDKDEALRWALKQASEIDEYAAFSFHDVKWYLEFGYLNGLMTGIRRGKRLAREAAKKGKKNGK